MADEKLPSPTGYSKDTGLPNNKYDDIDMEHGRGGDDAGHYSSDNSSVNSDAPLQGVRKVEALQAVWTKKSKVTLFIG